MDEAFQVWTLSCFTKSPNTSNAVFLYRAWTLSTADSSGTGDAFLSIVCNLRVASLISLKRIQRNFLHTATIKYKAQTTAISSPLMRKQMVYWYLFIIFFLITQNINFLAFFN